MTSMLRKVPCAGACAALLGVAVSLSAADVKPHGTASLLPASAQMHALLKNWLLATVSRKCPGFADGFENGGLIWYESSGGYCIGMHGHTITIVDPLRMNTVQHWGDPHENLNGKHIKDWGGAEGWDGRRRSILLDDGTRITMEALGPHGVTDWTSIYDGSTNLQYDNGLRQLMHIGTDQSDTDAREQAQYDGETAQFTTNITTGVASYTNLYHEDEDFNVVETVVPLGTTGGFDNPRQINDLFDDPRIPHT